MLSAHSGTGFGVTSGTLFLSDWGTLAPAAVVIVMALGGMAGSTAGGIKAIRVGLTAKGVAAGHPQGAAPGVRSHCDDLPQRQAPDPADAPNVRGATVDAAALRAHLPRGGRSSGSPTGSWEITETLFESVSAAANVGLSVGIVGAGHAPSPYR
jgi:trk system potassium uptake protein